MTAPPDPDLTAVPQRGAAMGAVGTPIGILAVVLAAIPLVGLYLFWAPGALSISLGAIGLWRGRRGRGPQTLSGAALGLGIASFLVAGIWILVGLLIRTVADQGCSGPCS